MTTPAPLNAYLNIAVPVPLDHSFTYRGLAGDHDTAAAIPGCRFMVPFGRQKLIGIMLDEAPAPDLPAAKIRAVLRQIDSTPIFPATLMALCRWAADYYHHPVGEVFGSAMPRLLRAGEPLDLAERILQPLPAALAELPSLAGARRQAALLALLRAQPEGLDKLTLKQATFSTATINAVIHRGLAVWSQRPVQATAFNPQTLQVNDAQVQLNAEQQAAVTALSQHTSGTWLLYGITGSGKTEVYFRAIKQALAAGRQVLVLVPEIGLTPQTVKRFRARFAAPIFVLHSGLSDRERLDGFRAASNGSAAIIIGTRSAIFTPLRNPGLIVIDEEHDASFKQQEGFRYSARDLAVLRGNLESIPVILGSATPSLESYQNALNGKYRLLSLHKRAGGAQPASYQVIDIRNQVLQEGFSARLVSLIAEHLGNNNQVLVFLNRRGFAPALLCHECGWLAECNKCDARLTYHQTLRALLCHHCGTQQPIVSNCPNCQSTQLVPLGAGTQRIESALQALFPDQPIVRIDRDTTRNKGAFKNIIDQLGDDQPAILVGTQLLAKGHHFPNVTLVAIVDMDAGFYSADFKATERMGQLLLQVGGRAGREQKPGTVAVQTHFPAQPMLRTLIDDGYPVFADQLLAERQLNDLPPFSHHTLLRAESDDRTAAMDFLTRLQRQLADFTAVAVLGPVPANMERRAGRFRAQLLFSSDSRREMHYCLDRCLQLIDSANPARAIRWSVDVDPVDLF